MGLFMAGRGLDADPRRIVEREKEAREEAKKSRLAREEKIKNIQAEISRIGFDYADEKKHSAYIQWDRDLKIVQEENRVAIENEENRQKANLATYLAAMEQIKKIENEEKKAAGLDEKQEVKDVKDDKKEEKEGVEDKAKPVAPPPQQKPPADKSHPNETPLQTIQRRAAEFKTSPAYYLLSPIHLYRGGMFDVEEGKVDPIEQGLLNKLVEVYDDKAQNALHKKTIAEQKIREACALRREKGRAAIASMLTDPDFSRDKLVKAINNEDVNNLFKDAKVAIAGAADISKPPIGDDFFIQEDNDRKEISEDKYNKELQGIQEKLGRREAMKKHLEVAARFKMFLGSGARNFRLITPFSGEAYGEDQKLDAPDINPAAARLASDEAILTNSKQAKHFRKMIGEFNQYKGKREMSWQRDGSPFLITIDKQGVGRVTYAQGHEPVHLIGGKEKRVSIDEHIGHFRGDKGKSYRDSLEELYTFQCIFAGQFEHKLTFDPHRHQEISEAERTEIRMRQIELNIDVALRMQKKGIPLMIDLDDEAYKAIANCGPLKSSVIPDEDTMYSYLKHKRSMLPKEIHDPIALGAVERRERVKLAMVELSKGRQVYDQELKKFGELQKQRAELEKPMSSKELKDMDDRVAKAIADNKPKKPDLEVKGMHAAPALDEKKIALADAPAPVPVPEEKKVSPAFSAIHDELEKIKEASTKEIIATKKTIVDQIQSIKKRLESKGSLTITAVEQIKKELSQLDGMIEATQKSERFNAQMNQAGKLITAYKSAGDSPAKLSSIEEELKLGDEVGRVRSDINGLKQDIRQEVQEIQKQRAACDQLLTSLAPQEEKAFRAGG